MRLRSHFPAAAAGPKRTWFVTFEGQLNFLASWLEPILDRPYLSAVPHEWLHLTLGEGHDVDTVRARCSELAPVDALVGPVTVVDDGVAAGLEPADELRTLYEAIGGSGDFAPQVSFAYANADAEMEELEVNASDAVLIDALSLVDLRCEGDVYCWELVERVPLGAAHA